MDQEEQVVISYEDINGVEDNEDQRAYSADMQLYENMHSSTPAQIDKHLEFIKFNNDGHLILGSSNLTGRYWGGSLWSFEDANTAPDIEKCKAGIEFTVGLVDAIVQENGTIIVAQDAGIIESVTLDEMEGALPHFKRESKVDEHHFAVVALKLTADKKSLISASFDASIRMMDPSSLSVLNKFDPAHLQEITSLDTHPTNSEVFLSASLDGNVLLWNLKNQKPASCIYRDVDDPPSCLCFLPSPLHHDSFLVGTLSGKICLRKMDVITHSINEIHILKRRIFRIIPNPHRCNEFAVCGDDSKLFVITLEGESLQTIYTSDDHSDFVRGLAWKDANTLYSCGYDKKVLKHCIPHQQN